MSKTYTCRVKKDLREEVREEDRVVYKLKPLPVADKEKMRNWMREALLEDGATSNADSTLSLDVEGVKVEIDLEKDEVRIVAETTEDIHVEKDEKRRVYDLLDNEKRAREKAEAQVEQELATEMEKAKAASLKRLRDTVSEALRQAEEEVKRRIRSAENIAIEKGLDEKARDFGEILDKEEAVDSEGNHRVVWRIKMR